MPTLVAELAGTGVTDEGSALSRSAARRGARRRGAGGSTYWCSRRTRA
ncbi:hypothetical protein G6539_08820 [Streptomyces albidoflavus]|nr:hypothetical protein [Streptomyces sp. WAC00276]MBL0800625.1 hypothetical protein [Streptomyces albidoflavus]MCK2145054.1 hypothetical protein [Streptomyces sp. WAC00276]